MTLSESIAKIKEESTSEEQFETIIEAMCRRAQKGLIPGVKVEDIQECVNNLNINESEELIKMISEVDSACKVKTIKEEYELSDIEFNNIALFEFYNTILESYSLLETKLGDKIYDKVENFKDWREDNPGSYGKVMAGVGAAAGVAATSPFLIDTARRHALRKNAMDIAYKDALKANYDSGVLAGKKAGLVGPPSPMDTAEIIDPAEKAAEAGKAFDAENPSLAKKIGSGVYDKVSSLWQWAQANPIPAAFGGGALALGTAGLLALLIRARRKRKQAMLREGLDTKSVFSYDVLLEVKSTLNVLDSKMITSLYENSNEVVSELILDSLKATNSINEMLLNENVTYINNNGNLKTSSTKDYIKDIHTYESTFKFNSVKKKDNKKQLKEEQLFKKLSEMSFEEILSEADNYL